METLIIAIAIVIILVVCFIFIRKVKKLKNENASEKSKHKTIEDRYNAIIKKVDKIIHDKPLRKGYYKKNLYQEYSNGDPNITFDVIVYVNELDRYKNGESKIELDYVENIWKSSKSEPNSLPVIISGFVSLIKTVDIEWLESEVDIKELRKLKIKHLKDIIGEK